MALQWQRQTLAFGGRVVDGESPPAGEFYGDESVCAGGTPYAPLQSTPYTVGPIRPFSKG